MIQVIHGEIWSDNFTELDQLIRDFQSCVRFSYCRFDKDQMVFNDVRKAAKAKYPMLNTSIIGNSWCRSETLRGEVFLQELLAGSKV